MAPGAMRASGFKATIDRPVVVRPVVATTPRVSDPFPVEPPPIASPGRLTSMMAIEQGRSKARARAIEASPKTARAAYRREEKGNAIGRKAVAAPAIRKNPPDPTGDLVTGMGRYTSAFSRTRFTTPFQVSYNLRRAYR